MLYFFYTMKRADKKIIKELKYVRGLPPETCLKRFPDFIIAGPQRTGSTWLWNNLKRHPRVFFPFPKELFYFDLLDDHDHPKFVSADINRYLRFFDTDILTFLERNVQSFRRCGEFYAPKIYGEASASYAAMHEPLVKELTLINPGIKVIINYRDPVERAWSHAKKDILHHLNKRSYDEVSKKEFLDFFSLPYQLACGRYKDMMSKWLRHVKKENLFVLNFDDIVRDPMGLLLKVSGFLDIKPDKKYFRNPGKVYQKGPDAPPMPSDIKEYLTELFAEETHLPTGVLG